MDSQKFISSISKILSQNQIKTRSIDIYSYASDAGFYEILPIGVCFPKNEYEIQAIIKESLLCDVPITFRAGGTSLSGQTVGNGIIVDLSRGWKKIEVLPDSVRVQPGVTGGIVNQYLKPFNRKIGPDPSSINSAMIGGILSNNASGMCCGVAYNSYHTLKSIRFILADGNIYDTGVTEDYNRFETEQYVIFTKLRELKKSIENNEDLFHKIRNKYRIKNTMGYSLNAFLDYDHPLDIISHLLIGAEGTLGFISEAVLITLPDKPFKATALLIFDSIEKACDAIIPLKELGAEALELMDRASLRSVENMKGLPEYVKNLDYNSAALLCDFQAFDEHQLDQFVNNAKLLSLDLLQPLSFTKDAQEQMLLWKIRKGMFPAVGAIRAKGTTVVLEDIAFPIQSLSLAVLDLQKLFNKFEYDNAIIFGHAKDGNLHFVITQGFERSDQVERYSLFMDEVVELVVNKYGGSLKAEHGTGRNMAPFVKTEWGDDAYQIMVQLKEAIDPFNIFNKGVIINEDKQVHLKNLKITPPVDAEIDKCIECGFCEQACPSRGITLSPRKRIVIRRAQQRLLKSNNAMTASELSLYFDYDGLKTCAVDGMCASDCPVEINTGDLVKRLRNDGQTIVGKTIAYVVAKNMRSTLKLLRWGLKLFQSSRNHFSYFGFDKKIPRFINTSSFGIYENENPNFVIFSACASRLMTNQTIHDTEHIRNITQKLGIKIKVLPINNNMCCGQAFSSKGFENSASLLQKKVVDELMEQTEGGRLPIVIDISSCSNQFMNLKFSDKEYHKKYQKLKFLDSVDFIHDHILPKLDNFKKIESLTLHPNCSIHKMQKLHKLNKIADVISHKVFTPKYATCCGMAGDRGFLVPELTESAVKLQVDEVQEINSDFHCSTSVTCNINLSIQTTRSYVSLYVLISKILEE